MKRRGFIKTVFAGCGALACSNVFGIDSLNNDTRSVIGKKNNYNVINIRFPDRVCVILEDGLKVDLRSNDGSYSNGDVEVAARQSIKGLNFYLNSTKKVSWVNAEWNIPHSADTLILGDHWERGYGDLQWKKTDSTRIMPWYFMEYDGSNCKGLGVMTGASSFCAWFVGVDKLRLQMDVRNGSKGVDLRNRELNMATVIGYDAPEGEKPFYALKNFCKAMCPSPILPKQPVYGINDWYFAYGNNSDKLILQTVDLTADLAIDTNNRPYCVIDAGWGCVAEGWGNAGCWSDNFYTPGDNFKDMAKLAADIRSRGMKPGLWMRPLCAPVKAKKTLLLNHPGRKPDREIFRDPTISENRAYIDKCFQTYHEWGYEFVKHDFTTYDIFGRWGFEMLTEGMTLDNWQFYDKTLTNAEVVLNLYKDIRKAAGSIVLLGCNTISHLSAGMFEVQRIGDDTSGKEWARTLKMGVNTLAFRGAHHNTFYAADADCVGLTKDIPWRLNAEWMELVAMSGTPLFISANPEAVGTEQKALMKKCFSYAAKELPVGEPLDWFDTLTPHKWILNEKEYNFKWK